jgi:hypothetical protein
MPVTVKRPPSTIEQITAGAEGCDEVVFHHSTFAGAPALRVTVPPRTANFGEAPLGRLDVLQLAAALTEWAEAQQA